MEKLKVVVNDRMQVGYVYWLTEPVGRNFPPAFDPELSPTEMLELGVFGGKYMTDCQKEFPKSWFLNAKLSPDVRNPKLNYFGVNASKPLCRIFNSTNIYSTKCFKESRRLSKLLKMVIIDHKPHHSTMKNCNN